MADPVAIADIEAAARRIKGRVRRTPLLENDALNKRTGARVLIKAEIFQRTGSFKPRGAFSRILALTPDERARGVIAYSSGNHAQGVALAASELGIKATIVIPADAPKLKIARARAYGAEIVLYDRVHDDREIIAKKIMAERGLTLVPPYNHPHIIAGQGTLGLELAEQARETGAELDVVVAPVGGGGLIAGISLALEAKMPNARVYGVEPEGFDDTRRSLEAGERVSNPRTYGSICDALLVNMPGELTFPINKRLLKGIVTVTDDEALAAVAFGLNELKLVAEPGGGVALAALLAGKLDVKGKAAVVVLSGGNASSEILARAAHNPA